MSRYEIKSIWNRDNRNGINDNFMQLFDDVKLVGMLSQSVSDLDSIVRINTNKIITLDKLNTRTEELQKDAERINQMNEDVQTQINNLVLSDGQSDAEVIQARGSYDVLNTRLNNMDNGVDKVKEDIKKLELYKKVYGSMSKLDLPSDYASYSNLDIFTASNGDVKVHYDVAAKKMPTTKTYYVDVVNGDNTNSGTESQPFKSINRALRYGDADTIIVKKGVYGWSNGDGGSTIYQTKPFNLIGEKGVIIGAHRDNLTWTADTTHSKVYKTTATNVVEIVDAFNIDNIKFLKKVTSVDLVSSTKGSYYINGTEIYVRLHDDRKPDEYVLPNMVNPSLKITDLSVYIENVVFTNGLKHTSTNGTHSLYAKNVDFLVGTNDNALSVVGSDSILQNCRAMYATRDGFNYHHNNGIKNKAIEIDCIGAYNGRDGADQNNGSTMHDGGTIIRVGGEYHHNHGPNVIDVNDGGKSYNVGVHAHHSTAVGNVSNVDFRVRDEGGGSEMYLVNCVSHDSYYSTSVEGQAVLHKENTLLLSDEIKI